MKINICVALVIFNVGFIYSQCAKIYVMEHISGSPICKLQQGDYIEICEDVNEVHGCPYNFYIYDKGTSNGSLTYQLSLNKGWSTHYMTLMVNPSTKRFGFVLEDQSAIYSYVTEKEMLEKRAEQIEKQKVEKQKQEEQIFIKEKKIKKEIIDFLNAKEYFKAKQLYNELINPDIELLTKIDSGWLLEEERLLSFYAKYKEEFDELKIELLNSDSLFKEKYNAEIKKKEVIVGASSHRKYLDNIQDQYEKSLFQEKLNYDSYLLSKKENKYLIIPIGIDGNLDLSRYDINSTFEMNLILNYFDSVKQYLPFLEFKKLDGTILKSPILGENNFSINFFSFKLPSEIELLYQKIINESGNIMLEKLFPRLELYFDWKESLNLKNLSDIPIPENGFKNLRYDHNKSLFAEFNTNIQKRLTKNKDISFKSYSSKFYNPLLLYLIKKTYPHADSLIFVFGDNLEHNLGNRGLHLPITGGSYYTPHYSGSIVPLEIGKVELNGDYLKVYDNHGNYKDIKISLVVKESKISLLDINLEETINDSTFFISGYREPKNMINQHPIFYEQFCLGDVDEYGGSVVFDEIKFLENSELLIQILPTYPAWKVYNKRYLRQENIPSTLLPDIHSVCFDFTRSKFLYIPTAEDKRKGIYDEQYRENNSYKIFLNNFFINLYNYIYLKDQGQIKKANKYLIRSNERFEVFKRLYFDPKYDK